MFIIESEFKDDNTIVLLRYVWPRYSLEEIIFYLLLFVDGFIF